MIRQSAAVCALVLLFSAALANGQVVLPERGQERTLRENVFGLGVFGGPTTGFGLSFRHHLPSAFSYQITGGIIKVGDRLSYDIGGEGQFDLGRGPTSRFFVAGGMGYYYSGKTSHNDMDGPARIGLGIGGEMAVNTGFHTTLEVMFTYFSDATVLPLPQLGFHYYFY